MIKNLQTAAMRGAYTVAKLPLVWRQRGPGDSPGLGAHGWDGARGAGLRPPPPGPGEMALSSQVLPVGLVAVTGTATSSCRTILPASMGPTGCCLVLAFVSAFSSL